jgi:hypothetical protein
LNSAAGAEPVIRASAVRNGRRIFFIGGTRLVE